MTVSFQHQRDTLLVLGNVPFRTCQQRPQHLSRALTRYADVVFVNPNRSFLQQYIRRDLALEDDCPTSGVRVLEVNAGLPFARQLNLLHRFNCRRSQEGLREFFATPTHVKAIIATFPDQWDLVAGLPSHVPVIYDIMDDFKLFLPAGRVSRYEDWNRRLMKRAEHTIVSSRVLEARYTREGWPVRYLGNSIPGYFIDRLATARPTEDLSHLPRPIFGYLGQISHWMDFEVIAALANTHATASIVLVGPRDVALPKLPANVHIRPAVREEAIPSVLNAFDVGLIPFRRWKTIDAVNPIKMFEYLAAGLPVLSADFAEMDEFGDLATLYGSTAEAVEQSRRIVPCGGENARSIRRNFAARYRWEDRATELWDLINVPVQKQIARAA